MKKQKLAIISNEKTYQNKSSYYCDNVDMKSIPEGLKKNFHIELFVRKSKKIHAHDAENVCSIGDVVTVEECRPLSKTKSWMLKSVEVEASEV